LDEGREAIDWRKILASVETFPTVSIMVTSGAIAVAEKYSATFEPVMVSASIEARVAASIPIPACALSKPSPNALRSIAGSCLATSCRHASIALSVRSRWPCIVSANVWPFDETKPTDATRSRCNS
jgi:hypothetical protein